GTSACIFSGILHTNFLTYVSMPAKFMHNLPKNLTAHLHHNLCAVLPKKLPVRGLDSPGLAYYFSNRSHFNHYFSKT
ncbi:MAG: hypothetical protein J6L99_06095, partial [Ruminococcus sp.]|nr:hypothetical protein [Ruminococcus sp.]